MSTVYTVNIEEATLANNAFRRVLKTNKNQQLVLMSLKPLEEIGMEVHETIDQFIRIERGRGVAIIGTHPRSKIYLLKDGDIIMIPAGTYHNIVNIGEDKMKLYTLYSPPEHEPGTYQEFHPWKLFATLASWSEV